MALTTFAQHDPGTFQAVAAKVVLRSDGHGVRVTKMRAVQRNDIMFVQTDLFNIGNTDRTVFYRYCWLNSIGNQVDDGGS